VLAGCAPSAPRSTNGRVGVIIVFHFWKHMYIRRTLVRALFRMSFFETNVNATNNATKQHARARAKELLTVEHNVVNHIFKLEAKEGIKTKLLV
jgi:hypothetical protein